MKRFLSSIAAAGLLLSPASAFALTPVLPALHVTVHGPYMPQSVPPGSQRVTMLQLEFTNETIKGIDLETLNIRHRGLGDVRDLDGIYLVDSTGLRLSDRFAFQRDGTAELRIWPALTIPSKETVTVLVLADFSLDAAISGEHRLWLNASADVDAGDADVTVTQSKTGFDVVRTGGGTPRSVITVSYPGLNERVRYGKNRLVGRIRLTADGSDDQHVTSLTLTNEGSATGKDVRNIVIESNRGQRLTEKVSELGGRTKDAVTLVFDPPLLIEDGDSVILNIRADVMASRRKTIQLMVEEPGDITSTSRNAR